MKLSNKIFFVLISALFVCVANLGFTFQAETSNTNNQFIVEASQPNALFLNPTMHHNNLHNHLLFEVEEDDKLSHFQKVLNCCTSFKLFSFEDVNLNISLQVKNKFTSTLIEFFKLHEPPIFIYIRVLII